MAFATLNQLRQFFGMTAAEFSAEWRHLSDQDKTDLKTGVGNGTFTY